MTIDQTAQSIIDNALSTAQTQTSLADAAANGAITASQGHAVALPREVTYALQAIEPAVPDVENSTATYEAQRDYLIALLTSKLADFFATYYPLASDAYDEATNWLVNTITIGGTGISPAVENAIWQRDRDRVIADGQRAEAQTYDEFTKRGFSLPPGALAARLQEIRFEQLAKTQAQSRDVAIKQAEIEIDNLRFAVEQALKARLAALDAAANYLRAIMTGPDIASRIASLNSDAKARMLSATADLYRARLSRDELAMRIPIVNQENASKYANINTDGFYKGVDARVQAAVGAAQVYGQAASAALSALNSVASLSAVGFA
jgi:hypothetical protein